MGNVGKYLLGESGSPRPFKFNNSNHNFGWLKFPSKKIVFRELFLLMAFGFLGCIYVYNYINRLYIYWMNMATTMGTCNINIFTWYKSWYLTCTILSNLQSPTNREGEEKRTEKPTPRHRRLVPTHFRWTRSEGYWTPAVQGVCHEGQGHICNINPQESKYIL